MHRTINVLVVGSSDGKAGAVIQGLVMRRSQGINLMVIPGPHEVAAEMWPDIVTYNLNDVALAAAEVDVIFDFSRDETTKNKLKLLFQLTNNKHTTIVSEKTAELFYLVMTGSKVLELA